MDSLINVGMVLEDVYDLLGFMVDNSVFDDDCVMFGRWVLQYVCYLCREEGVELCADVLSDDYFNYLMDLEKEVYFKSLGVV